MKEWMQKQIDTDFRDLQGLSVTARVPLKDAVVNELIAQALQKAPGPPSNIDLSSFKKFVQKAEVHASEGVISLDIVVKI
jgi:hypothetical protein